MVSMMVDKSAKMMDYVMAMILVPMMDIVMVWPMVSMMVDNSAKMVDYVTAMMLVAMMAAVMA